MKPRSTRLIASLPKAERLPAIAEGLGLVAEHALGMEAAAASQAGPFGQRAAAAIRAISDEEAGKYLVLLDAVRSGLGDQPVLARQLSRCGDHLSKGIYARVVGIRPGTYRELLGYLDGLRASHYLDGPNEVDWVFGNQIETEREDHLYVDYVEMNEGPTTWLSPARYDSIDFRFSQGAVELVRTLHAAGADTLDGLAQIADVWGDFRPEPETHWQESHTRNLETLGRLQVLKGVDFERDDIQTIADTWTFPLVHADLSRIRVDVTELLERRKQVFAAMNTEMQREMYGDYEDEMRAEAAQYNAEMQAEYANEYADEERANYSDEGGY